MSEQTVKYAVRRLNPFQGMVQVVELGDARALSLGGEHWEIQVRCAQPEHTWRSANQGEPVMRFLRFGTWSIETGLRQAAVSPILNMDLLLRASAAITQVLPQCLRVLPFPSADRHELWLMDAEAKPFALLAATTQAPIDAPSWREPWAATARADHRFQSPRLVERGVPLRHGHDPRHHAALLERLVGRTAGSPARTCWFVRDADGRGSAMDLQKAKTDEEPRRLPDDDFPALLLREEWPRPLDRDLVRDYLDWCAPYLLTLPGLNNTQRDRFEHAARPRALEVEAVHRLYPKIINPAVLTSIRVEARMRRSRIA